MPVCYSVIPSIKFVSTHVYTWMEGSTCDNKASWLRKQYNVPTKAQTQTAPSGDKRTNQEANAPPLEEGSKADKWNF